MKCFIFPSKYYFLGSTQYIIGNLSLTANTCNKSYKMTFNYSSQTLHGNFRKYFSKENCYVRNISITSKFDYYRSNFEIWLNLVFWFNVGRTLNIHEKLHFNIIIAAREIIGKLKLALKVYKLNYFMKLNISDCNNITEALRLLFQGYTLKKLNV